MTVKKASRKSKPEQDLQDSSVKVYNGEICGHRERYLREREIEMDNSKTTQYARLLGLVNVELEDGSDVWVPLNGDREVTKTYKKLAEVDMKEERARLYKNLVEKYAIALPAKVKATKSGEGRVTYQIELV